ncbi:MAG: uroporphyrinogen-III C-methyltransferase [Candidatus Melainabacteria bacterium RIFOXYA12_FULL_32_12]|nr:MAG: uroporphyrinogen-III C-methyltransferase [Candidatus Melainabacteria bacterium RIFOXYA12_FULL_32_12]
MENKVYLLGAGPGDEGLITVKGLECIKNADVIVYDNLVNENLLSFAKDTVEKIYVGKKINQHTLVQDEINKLLVQKAKEGKTVVRLKGGDPFVFGRGGEEALELKKEDIPFEIVPGISSSIAALAYAGIPITHRAISTSFHVITGHEDPTKEEESVDYQALAQLKGTLVFLMGLNNLGKICSQLLKYGKSSDTPAAVVSKGTTSEQKVAVGTLDNIEQKLDNITYPAIIVVGDVINLRESLNWFENKPLFGRKILVTRARHQASALVKKIEEAGGRAIEFPTIEIQSNDNDSQLKQMFDSLNNYQWVIFTSVNGVEIFFEKLKSNDKDIRTIGQAKLCAIGEATRQALENYYLKVDFTPHEYVAEALVEGLKERIKAGDKVLIPRADVAREILPDQLKEMCAVVDVVPLYKTVLPNRSAEELKDILDKVDTITFASSSTVTNFIQILGRENLHLLDNKEIACIGPITLDTARENGLKSIKMAKKYTIDGLVSLLMEK